MNGQSGSTKSLKRCQRTEFCRNRMNKQTKRSYEVIVTSYSYNKNRNNKKKQEKADNSPSYRFAASNKKTVPTNFKRIALK